MLLLYIITCLFFTEYPFQKNRYHCQIAYFSIGITVMQFYFVSFILLSACETPYSQVPGREAPVLNRGESGLLHGQPFPIFLSDNSLQKKEPLPLCERMRRGDRLIRCR